MGRFLATTSCSSFKVKLSRPETWAVVSSGGFSTGASGRKGNGEAVREVYCWCSSGVEQRDRDGAGAPA